MADVKLLGVAKHFGDAVVLRPLDLLVEDGEFLVLLGPSGCGKSTTLRMIAGLEAPTQGRIEIDGRDVTDAAPKDRDVAMVFQNYALYPHLSVRENLGFGLKMRRRPADEIRTRVAEAADMLGLTPLLDRKPKALSGGQRQRVAMGRALVRRPKVFLFDEPLSNLDANLRTEMRAEIARLHRALGITTIYVTHDQVEAMTLATRIAILHEGRLQQLDTPRRIFEVPANRFVARFLGSPPMNQLEGTVAEGAFRAGALRVSLPKGLALSAGPATIGFRPHAASLVSDAREASISGEVELVEPTGHEQIVRLRSADIPQPLTVCLSERSPPIELGATISVRVPEQAWHYFGPDGESVPSGGVAGASAGPP